MPLASVGLTAVLSWELEKTNPPFSNITTLVDDVNFSLFGLDINIWNQLYAVEVTLAPSTTEDIDLYSFTNLIDEATGFVEVLTLFILVDGGEIDVLPSPSAGVGWLFEGSDGFSVRDFAIHSAPVDSELGAAIDSTHRNLRLSNGGGTSVDVIVMVIGTDGSAFESLAADHYIGPMCSVLSGEGYI